MKLSDTEHLHREFAGVIKAEDFSTEHPNPYRSNPLTLIETQNRKCTANWGSLWPSQFIGKERKPNYEHHAIYFT